MLSSSRVPHNCCDPMYQWAQDMWSYPRSITGIGVRQTIGYLQKLISGLEMHHVASGTRVFDWVVPNEYFVKDAYIETLSGRRLVDYAENNLHLVGYSTPVNDIFSKASIESKLHYLMGNPSAIPYITSYYKENWGFCLTYDQYKTMDEDTYRVVIDSTSFTGELNYADIVIPGETDEEILLSTYICHPMMANDSLSGVVVTAALARYIQAKAGNHRYTYRIVFVPETIGTIAYLATDSRWVRMKNRTVAGYVITCCGDSGPFSIIESRNGRTLADRAAEAVVMNHRDGYNIYSFTNRGSDERQYCYPGIDLPVASVTRTKYAEYAEYHTSLDNLSFISQGNLEETFQVYKNIIELIELNRKYTCTTMCEPSFSRRGLRYSQSSPSVIPHALNILAYCDGTNDTIDLVRICGMDSDYVLREISSLEIGGAISR